MASAQPDGYRFVLGHSGTHAINQTLYKKPLYNAATDFSPVALVAEVPFLVVARKALPANNLREFIAYAKVHHATMRYGSGGVGSGVHLACALLNSAIGVDVTHIPYRGGGPAMQDLIAGLLDYQCTPPAVAATHIENKSVKTIAILTKNRSSLLPGAASAHEQGLTNFEATGWNAIFLPKETPGPIVQKLHVAIVGTLETTAVQQQLKKIGLDTIEADRRSPEYVQKFVASEIEKWAKAIKAANIALQ